MRIVGLRLIILAGMAALLTLSPVARGLEPIFGNGIFGAGGADQIEDARKTLSLTEAAHPGNTIEVADALITLMQRLRAAVRLTAETGQVAERTLKVAEAAAGRESAVYARALAEVAKLKNAEDQAELARPMAEEALEIARRNAQGTLALAEVADALGKICYRLRDFPCALQAEREAVAAARQAPGDSQLYLVSMLQQLAVLDLEMQDEAGLRTAVTESTALIDQQTRMDPSMTELESNAGYFLAHQGETEEARVHIQRALELSKQMFGPESVQTAYALLNLAAIDRSSGHMQQAHEDYEKGLRLIRRLWGPTHTYTATYEGTDAELLFELGRYKEAIELSLQVHRTLREYSTLAMRVLPERQALASAMRGTSALSLALTAAAADPDLDVTALYQEQIRSRGLVTEEMARRQAGLNRDNDPETERLIQELEQEDEQALELSKGGAGHGEELARALNGIEKTERSLAEKSLVYRSSQRAETVVLAEVRHRLPADAALISYVHFYRYLPGKSKFEEQWEPGYMAFVLAPGQERIRLFDLGDGKSIDELVGKLRASAESEAHSGGLGAKRNERMYRTAGEALRQRIWDPLRAEIGMARMALVVADGQLNLIPFAGLPEGNGYLVDSGPVIHMLTSERDLIPASEKSRKSGLLAIGSPHLDPAGARNLPATLRGSATGCGNSRQMGFEPLPGTAEELKDIDSVWQRWNHQEGDALISGDEATRDRFLREASRHRVLHVATHAYLLDASCGNENPLLRSGLVFSGAAPGKEASVVTAQQIASLDLRGVDWAVLSACNTGNGELKDGEGVLGLERAFRVAGAHSVVMTLWPVDDQTTRGFMQALYAERLGRKASTADSVWRAARTMLATRRGSGRSTHPWYWAGFVGAGGWE